MSDWQATAGQTYMLESLIRTQVYYCGMSRGATITAAASIAGVCLGYAYLAGKQDLELAVRQYVQDEQRIPALFLMIPPLKDRALDAYLEKMKVDYVKADYQYNTIGFDRALRFARDSAPDREGKVYDAIVEFLIARGDISEASFYAAESLVWRPN